MRDTTDLCHVGDSVLPGARTRPVALTNTSFHLGSILAVELTGIALPVLGWLGVLATLGSIVAAVFLVAAFVTGRARVLPDSSNRPWRALSDRFRSH